jgi:hypothetical protein
MPRQIYKKRKAESDPILEDKIATKRRRLLDLEEKWTEAEKQIEEDSDLSDNDEPISYNINELLAPQEKLILRKDPFGTNFMATTWTNESTLLRKNSTFSRWELENSPSTIFPPEIFMQLISWCASGTLFALRRVSKFMNILILESHGTWRKLFYQRHWRLRHDIENIFIGTDPDAADKSGWRDVCPEEDIDWFGEYRRNHINAVLIRSLIEEIKPKLQKIVDRVAVPKAGVTDPSFFEKGCTDNEIDTTIEMAGTTITNDLRELLKCCNGAKFSVDLSNSKTDNFLCIWPIIKICFPVLDYLTLGWKQSRFDKLESTGWFSMPGEEDEEEEYTETSEGIRPEVNSDPDPLQFSESDLLSDSEEYIPSDQETSTDSYEENDQVADPEPTENPNLDLSMDEDDYSYFDTEAPMTRFKTSPGAWNKDDYAGQQLYSKNDGAIVHSAQNSSIIDFTYHDSIVTYLQRISDLLDFEHAERWLVFEDYISLDDSEDDERMLGAHYTDLTAIFWARIIADIHQNYRTDEAIVPRGEKLLVAAVQDFAEKLFAKAQALETTDTLQPDTLIAAVRQISPEWRNYQRRTNDTNTNEKPVQREGDERADLDLDNNSEDSQHAVIDL